MGLRIALKFGIVLGTLLILSAAAVRVEAVVYEKYLLVMPLRPANQSARKQAWFGKAFRQAMNNAVLSMQSLIFLKDDELASLQDEFQLGSGTPEPGQLEHLADSKDIALLYGTYLIKGNQLIVNCQVIPGRNFEVSRFKVTGSPKKLEALFTSIIKHTTQILDLEVSEDEMKSLRRVPGTHTFAAFYQFHRASNLVAADPENKPQCQKALPELNKALKRDPAFVPALALRADCRLTLASGAKVKERQSQFNLAKRDLEKGLKFHRRHPLLMNAQVKYFLLTKKYAKAREIGQENLMRHPANFRNYLLLGMAYRMLKMPDEAEKILIQGLDQQGTELQKKPFNRDLGLLLLKRKDKHAVVYLKEVLELETRNAKLHYLRAAALYRLERYLDAMKEIQTAEAVKNWKDLQRLKARTTRSLGRIFFEEGDYDRAYSYTSIAMNLAPNNFETLLLMAKVLRKKGFHQEARHQLDVARATARKKHPKDHLWLGTEFVAQGHRQEGVEEYRLYLKLNPKAPERRRLISLIRKLQGDADE